MISKLRLQESLKSQHSLILQHKLYSIISQIARQPRWNREQETWKIHKTAAIIHGLYVTVMMTFQQSERSNWSTTSYKRSNSSDPKIFALKKILKTLLQCETNFSLLKQILQDPNGQIEVPQDMKLLTKFQYDPTAKEATTVAESCWTKHSLFPLYSFTFLSLSHGCSRKNPKND